MGSTWIGIETSAFKRIENISIDKKPAGFPAGFWERKGSGLPENAGESKKVITRTLIYVKCRVLKINENKTV